MERRDTRSHKRRGGGSPGRGDGKPGTQPQPSMPGSQERPPLLSSRKKPREGRMDGIPDTVDKSLNQFREMMRDREAWHAAVRGVTESWKRLGDRTTITVWTGSRRRLLRAPGSAGLSPALKSAPGARPCVSAVPGGSRSSPLEHSVGAPGCVPDRAHPQGHCSPRPLPAALGVRAVLLPPVRPCLSPNQPRSSP